MFRAPPKPSVLSALWAPALLAASLSCGLVSAAGAQTVGEQAISTHERGVDTSVRPGDDFFGYANGDWLKATEIPAGKQRWDARSEIAELTRRRILSLLAEAGA
jgi:putative endopeptidase